MATAEIKEHEDELEDNTKPPFLRRVRIRNYKSIAFCDVTLEPLTVLVGRNGSGKSNFLDALAFLRDAVDISVTEAVKRRGNWGSISCRTTESQKVQLEMECLFPRAALRGDSICRESNGVSLSIGKIDPLTHPWVMARYLLQVALINGLPCVEHEKIDYPEENDERIPQFDLWHREPNSDSPSSVHGVIAGSVEAEDSFLGLREDRCLLGATHVEPFFSLANSIRSMGFYNTHPDAIRFQQKPTLGPLEKDGRNLVSVKK